MVPCINARITIFQIELNIKENGVVYFSLEPKPLHIQIVATHMELVMQYEKKDKAKNKNNVKIAYCQKNSFCCYNEQCKKQQRS